MSLQVVETGEVVEEMTRVEAERITSRIADKLDTIADNLEQVLPLIGEALTREAWRALDYASPTAYVSERFAGALTRLPIEVRRPVVAQLSAAGMSTRAIAPIVGVSQKTVDRDARNQVSHYDSPKPERETGTFQTGAAWVESGDEIPLETETTYDKETYEVLEEAPLPKSEKIIGADGKEYKRPEPVAQPELSKPKRRPLPDQLRDAGWELTKVTEKLQRLFEDDRFERSKKDVTAPLRGHIENNIAELTKMLDALNK